MKYFTTFLFGEDNLIILIIFKFEIASETAVKEDVNKL